jgi:hypothetical protein
MRLADKTVEVPVQTPLVKRRGVNTEMFCAEPLFISHFNTRTYVSAYGGALTYYLLQDGIFEDLRRAADAKRTFQIEVYANWVIDGEFTDKLVRELPYTKNKPLKDLVWDAVFYLRHVGPHNKRTPKNFREEDRNWRYYIDENGVHRLRLSSEYRLTPGLK